MTGFIAQIVRMLETRTGRVVFVVFFSLSLSLSLFYFSHKYGVIGDFTFKELEVGVKLLNMPEGYVESTPCKVRVKVKGFALDIVRFSPEDLSCTGELLREPPRDGGLIDVKIRCETPKTSVFLEYPEVSKVLLEKFVRKSLPVRVQFQNVPPGLSVSYEKTHVKPREVELSGGELVNDLNEAYVLVDMNGYAGSGKESLYLPIRFSDGRREYTAEELTRKGVRVSVGRVKVYFEYSEGEKLYVAFVDPVVTLESPAELFLKSVVVKPPSLLSRRSDVEVVRTSPAFLKIEEKEGVYAATCEGCEVLDIFQKKGEVVVSVSLSVPPGFSEREVVVQYVFSRAVRVRKFLLPVEVRGVPEGTTLAVEPEEVLVTLYGCEEPPSLYVEFQGHDGVYPLKYEGGEGCYFVSEVDSVRVRVKGGEVESE